MLSVRRLQVLAEHLPRDSAVVRAELGDGADWGVGEHLLASLIEVVDAVSWRAVLPHARKGWKPPKRLQIPRPGEKKKRRRATSSELIELFAGRGRYVEGGER